MLRRRWPRTSRPERGQFFHYLARGLGRVGVDCDRVFHVQGVAAGQHDGHRYPVLEGGPDHHVVALLQAVECQGESSELVFEIRVRAGHIEHQVGLEHVEGGVVSVAQTVNVFGVSHPVGQVDVQAGGRLELG